MKQFKNLVTKLSKNRVIISLALVLIATAEMSTMVCANWIFGQDDMPEELLK